VALQAALRSARGGDAATAAHVAEMAARIKAGLEPK